MARHLVRNLVLLLSAAAVLLTIFEASGRSIPVLPADASPVPVLVGAALLGAGVTAIEQKVRSALR
ncbi:MAG TPA: hypothetical protein VG076_00975 [Acidimicrobiales bacterium]|nr:hypothetical protein [Acidimicrobiales bacterium]